MAAALIHGLLQSGYSAQQLSVVEPDENKHAAYTAKAVRTATTADSLIAAVDILVLAVKPQVMAQVCQGLASALNARLQQSPVLVVSIAAGVESQSIVQWLGGSAAVVRVMPNTPALVGAGAAGLFANASVSAEQKQQAEALLKAVGELVWVSKETDIDAVTALSGSGPAYYFLFMEAQMAAAEALGLSNEAARLLTLQTAYGAAKMALSSEHSPAQLRQNVTSPGGTTERALAEFEQGQLRELVATAMQAANGRAAELAAELVDELAAE